MNENESIREVFILLNPPEYGLPDVQGVSLLARGLIPTEQEDRRLVDGHHAAACLSNVAFSVLNL